MNDEHFQDVYAHKVKDYNLVTLVNLVNKANFEMGMTLFVKGVIVTGSLISGYKYHDIMANQLAAVNEVGEALSTYYRDNADDMYKPDQNGESSNIPCNYLHMKNVKISGDSGFRDMNNALLRINIAEVDGHIVGSTSSN